MNKITIIVATYNDDPVALKRTVESVKKQTFKNWELIVVDSGNCEIKNEEKIKVVKTPPKGVADAFNVGLKWATGDYIYVLGAGDYLWTDEALEKMVEGADPKKDILVCGRINRLSKDNKVIYRSEIGTANWRLIYKMILPHQGLLMSKSYFEKYGYFDVKCKYAMDYEIILRSFFEFPKVVWKDMVVASWIEGGIGQKETDKVLAEYHRIRIKNKIAPRIILELIYKLSKLRYGY